MSPEAIRVKLQLSRSEFARALGINERTVARWEEEGVSPSGLAAEVIRAVSAAIDSGADPAQIGRSVASGVGQLLFLSLTAKAASVIRNR